MDRKKPLRDMVHTPPPDHLHRSNMLIQRGGGNGFPGGEFVTGMHGNRGGAAADSLIGRLHKSGAIGSSSSAVQDVVAAVTDAAAGSKNNHLSRLGYFSPNPNELSSGAAAANHSTDYSVASASRDSVSCGSGKQSSYEPSGHSSQYNNKSSALTAAERLAQEQAQKHKQGAQQVLESQLRGGKIMLQNNNNDQVSDIILQQSQELQQQHQKHQHPEHHLQQQHQAILNAQNLLRQTNSVLLDGDGLGLGQPQQGAASDGAQVSSVADLQERLIAAAEALGQTSQKQPPTSQQQQRKQHQHQQLNGQLGSLGAQLGMSSSKNATPSNHSLLAALGGGAPANAGLDLAALAGTPGLDLSASNGDAAASAGGLDISKMLNLVTGAGAAASGGGVGPLLTVVTALQKALQAQQQAQQRQQQAATLVNLLQQYTAVAAQGAAPVAPAFGLQPSATGNTAAGSGTRNVSERQGRIPQQLSSARGSLGTQLGTSSSDDMRSLMEAFGR
mmetsp:Transcript_30543/g.45512  ORF Transcript_30543/g.45512 Transcript_30543/m.45512 type:complete len:502 (-) Transcript_30543:239-1744(-)